VVVEDGGDGGKEVLVGEHFVGAAVGPGGFDAEQIFFLEPEGNERRLAQGGKAGREF
jgi:hypothetical protein